MTGTILAVDLGKFNSVLCWYESASRVVSNRPHHAGGVASRTEAAARHADRLRGLFPGRLVHDLCEQLGLPVLVASTTGAAWQWKRVSGRPTATMRSSSAGGIVTSGDRKTRSPQAVTVAPENGLTGAAMLSRRPSSGCHGHGLA